MKKPNFFIIGEPKCGTTIIHDYLSKHKDVFMAGEVTKNGKEEMYFFCSDLKDEINKHGGKVKDFNTYMSFFKKNKNYSIVGESSPGYAFSKTSANEIFNFNKKALLLYSIREPFSFLQSRHAQSYKRGLEDESNFLTALKLESERKNGNKVPNTINFPSRLYYSERIKYFDHLQRYLNIFPPEQIKVIIYEEFKNDNQKTIDEITDFLGVKRMKIEYKQVNVRAKIKYPGLQRFLKNRKIRNFAQKILPYAIRKARGNFTRGINPLIPEKAPELPQHEVTRLKKQFKPEVVKINNLLHKHNLIDPKIDLVEYRGYDKV